MNKARPIDPLIFSLKRYQDSVNATICKVKPYRLDRLSLTRKRPTLVDEVLKREISSGIKVPQELRDLWTIFGSFYVPDSGWGRLELFDTTSVVPLFSGLADTIIRVWGGRPEFAESFSEEELRSLDSKYFCFGYFVSDSNRHVYLFFKEGGGADCINFDQDYWDEFESEVKSRLLKEKPLTKNVWQVIDQSISMVIAAFQENCLDEATVDKNRPIELDLSLASFDEKEGRTQ